MERQRGGAAVRYHRGGASWPHLLLAGGRHGATVERQRSHHAVAAGPRSVIVGRSLGLPSPSWRSRAVEGASLVFFSRWRGLLVVEPPPVRSHHGVASWRGREGGTEVDQNDLIASTQRIGAVCGGAPSSAMPGCTCSRLRTRTVVRAGLLDCR